LIILFYTQLGYYGQFVVQQWRLKEAAHEEWIAAQPDAAFFRVRLSDINAGGRWEEEGREVWYKEHLYDVIRQRTTGGVVWLFCLDDEREAKLIRQSGEMTGASQEHPDKKTGHSLSVRIGDIVCEPTFWHLNQPAALPKSYLSSGTCPLPTRWAEIVIPPPKG
jgi:hypothetical protein